MITRIVSALLVAISTFGAELVWEPGSETPARYNVYITGHAGAIQRIPVGTATNFTLNGLTPGTNYLIHVTAENMVTRIESEPSEVVHYTPVPGYPPEPVLVTNSVTRSGTNWTVKATWKAVPKVWNVDGYWVKVKQLGAVRTNIFVTSTNVTFKVPVASPTEISIVATNAVGESSNEPFLTYSQPPTPLRPQVTNIRPVQ